MYMRVLLNFISFTKWLPIFRFELAVNGKLCGTSRWPIVLGTSATIISADCADKLRTYFELGILSGVRPRFFLSEFKYTRVPMWNCAEVIVETLNDSYFPRSHVHT